MRVRASGGELRDVPGEEILRARYCSCKCDDGDWDWVD